MSIVKCKVCEKTQAVYYRVMDKKNYTCDSCVKKECKYPNYPNSEETAEVEG